MADLLRNHADNVLAAPTPSRAADAIQNGALVIAGSLFMGLCAHVSLPLPFSPVPLTLQTFGVLLLGLTLGSRRAFAAMVLYLLEGASGLPVFSPAGPGGVAQLLGPTGGYLLAYPAAAFLAGWVFTFRQKTMGAALAASVIAEIAIFACGATWLRVLSGTNLSQVAQIAVLPFIAGEVLKVAAASAIAVRWSRFRQN